MSWADDTTALVGVVGLASSIVYGIVRAFRRLIGRRLTAAERDRRLTAVWLALRLDDPRNSLPVSVDRLADNVAELSAVVGNLAGSRPVAPSPARGRDDGPGPSSAAEGTGAVGRLA